VVESRVQAPLMRWACSACANVSTANVVSVLWAAAMFAWFFLSALYLQLVLRYSPLQVGLAFLPANLIMGAFSYSLSAKTVNRFGIRAPLAVGLAIAAAAWACSPWRRPTAASGCTCCRPCCCWALGRAWPSTRCCWRP
jgi:hypothetical protein